MLFPKYPYPHHRQQCVVDDHIPHIAPRYAIWKTVFRYWEQEWSWVKIYGMRRNIDKYVQQPAQQFIPRTLGKEPHREKYQGPYYNTVAVLVQIRRNIETLHLYMMPAKTSFESWVKK